MSDDALVPYSPPVEIVDKPAGHVRILTLRNPFTLERTASSVAEGATIAEIVAGLGFPEWWPSACPTTGR